MSSNVPKIIDKGQNNPVFLLCHKPVGHTSRKAMREAVDSYCRLYNKAISKKTRLGIEGILDPFAEGLLIAGIGAATRFFRFFHALPKTYLATIDLGGETSTLDTEGTLLNSGSEKPVTAQDIESIQQHFFGHMQQIPPAYSNARIDGERARDRARRGVTVNLKPRDIFIHQLDVTDYSSGSVEFEVKVSAGTYIRSLGQDIARHIGQRGHLKRLIRTGIGDFKLQSKGKVETNAQNRYGIPYQTLNTTGLVEVITPRDAMGFIPELLVDSKTAADVHLGKKVALKDTTTPGQHRLIDAENDNFLGIVEIEDSYIKPLRLMPQS